MQILSCCFMSFFCHGLVLKLIFQYLENELFTMHSLSDSHPAYAGLYNVTLLFFATVILTFLKNHIRIIRIKKNFLNDPQKYAHVEYWMILFINCFKNSINKILLSFVIFFNIEIKSYSTLTRKM